MRENTPPASPYDNDITLNEDDELIYIGDADEVLDAWEAGSDGADEELGEGDENSDVDDNPPIPEHDDSIITFTNHNAPVFCGSLHPTQKIAVTGGEDDIAFVWNTETGDVIHECKGHKDTVIGAEFSRDGNYLATGDMAGEIQLFNVNSNYEKVWEFSMGDMSWMKWHHKTNVLMAGAESGEIYAWRLPSGECKVFAGEGKKCEVGVITEDGKKLIAGYSDGVVKYWDFKTNTTEFEINSSHPLGHEGAITSLCADSENQIFITGCEDGKMLIGGRNGAVGNLNSNGGSVEAVAFCHESDLSFKLVASGTLQGKITIWDITKQTVRAECDDGGHPTGVTVAKWLPEMTLVVGTLDGTIKLFDGRSGQSKLYLHGHVAEIYDLQYSKESNIILTTSEDKTAKIFRLI